MGAQSADEPGRALDEDFPLHPHFPVFFAALGAAFGAIGRVLVCLDEEFSILHASYPTADLVGEDVAASLPGRPIEEVLGAELFGPGGTMRQALLRDERQEGWRATVQTPKGRRQVSVTGAPLDIVPESPCDPRVRYLVVMRPIEEDPFTGTSAPTAFEGMVACSPSMLKLFDLAETLEHSDATVLITGDSGTGKEVMARAVHARSSRREGPFVAVNCGALPEQLLQSELFGHARGAFTGAVRERGGRFELADGGTLFLDEIGDTSSQLQVELLRVLQERTYERVGESRSRSADVRIVAATNRDLARAVDEGRFRKDLYYRLRVVPIEIPPLRTRREDIAPLAQHLLARVGARHGRQLRFSPDALRALLPLDWPGNVRQLENALEYAVAVCRGQTVHLGDLPPEIRAEARAAADSERLALLNPGQILAPLGATPTQPVPASPLTPPRAAAQPPPAPPAEGRERAQILAALDSARWRREEAARTLGISRTTLWRKMREYGIR
jgi:DNA-binding NtrC family response regulator